jgi:hypothetical protein
MAQTIPLSVPDDLLNEVRETAKLTHLSVQDVFRQSARIAKPALRQTARPERPKRLSLWDALASGSGLEFSVAPLGGVVEKVTL